MSYDSTIATFIHAYQGRHQMLLLITRGCAV